MSKRLRQLWRSRIVVIGLVLGSLGAAYLLLCLWLARGYLRPPRQIMPPPPWVTDEIWHLGNGQTVPVWVSNPASFAKQGKSDVVVVLVHGYCGSRAFWAGPMLDLQARGYTVVAPAMPGHDTHPHPTTSMGVSESALLVELCRKIRAHGNEETKIIGVGISMGAAAVWLASSRDAMAWDAILSDSSFATLPDAMNNWFNLSMPGGRYFLAPVGWLSAKLAKINPKSIRPIDAAKAWQGRPASIVMGDQDEIMPRGHATDLAEASGNTVCWIEGAGHIDCCTVGHSTYLSEIDLLAARVKQVGNQIPREPNLVEKL